MTILSVSKENNEAVIKLSSDELIELCNVMHKAKDTNRHAIFYKMYGNMVMARDLSQHGSIDAFSFERIAECRNMAMQLATTE